MFYLEYKFSNNNTNVCWLILSNNLSKNIYIMYFKLLYIYEILVYEKIRNLLLMAGTKYIPNIAVIVRIIDFIVGAYTDSNFNVTFLSTTNRLRYI